MNFEHLVANNFILFFTHLEVLAHFQLDLEFVHVGNLEVSEVLREVRHLALLTQHHRARLPLTIPDALDFVVAELHEALAPDDFAAHVARVDEHELGVEVAAEVVRFAVEELPFVDPRYLQRPVPLASQADVVGFEGTENLVLRISQVQPILIKPHPIPYRIVPRRILPLVLHIAANTAEQIIDVLQFEGL